MRYETKGGLFKPKPLSVKSVYGTDKLQNTKNFSVILYHFKCDKVVKSLIYQYVNSLSFKLSAKIFEKQLKLLEPLTTDEQLKILNLTLDKGWGSLVFAYNIVRNNKNTEQK